MAKSFGKLDVTYLLNNCKAGTGNDKGVQVTIVRAGMDEDQHDSAERKELNRNVQEYFRYLSGQTFATTGREADRPDGAAKAMWKKVLEEGKFSFTAKEHVARPRQAGESIEQEMARRLAAGESVAEIAADLAKRVEMQAEELRKNASNTVQVDEDEAE